MAIPRNWIPRLLTQRNWSDGDLAQRTGMSRAHLNRVKNRRARPTLRDALIIAAAFEVPVEEVFVCDAEAVPPPLGPRSSSA